MSDTTVLSAIAAAMGFDLETADYVSAGEWSLAFNSVVGRALTALLSEGHTLATIPMRELNARAVAVIERDLLTAGPLGGGTLRALREWLLAHA